MKNYLKWSLSLIYWFTKILIVIPWLLSVAFTPLNYVGLFVVVSVPFVAYKNYKILLGGKN